MWAVLLISSSLTLAGLAEDIFLEFGIDPFEYIPNIFHGFGLALGVQVLDVYLTIVSMRIIGLYYLHFKRKFAFKLE